MLRALKAHLKQYAARGGAAYNASYVKTVDEEGAPAEEKSWEGKGPGPGPGTPKTPGGDGEGGGRGEGLAEPPHPTPLPTGGAEVDESIDSDLVFPFLEVGVSPKSPSS